MVKSPATVTCDGHAEEGGKGPGGQDESPSAGKLPGPYSIQRVLVQGVLISAQAESVDPGKEDVSVVSVDGGQSQQRDGCAEEIGSIQSN